MNSETNLVGSPSKMNVIDKTTMYDPNHMNKFIEKSTFAARPSRSSVSKIIKKNEFDNKKNTLPFRIISRAHPG